ncbi:MAG: DUF481 domain-containing protein [Myxococcota bacterium]
MSGKHQSGWLRCTIGVGLATALAAGATALAAGAAGAEQTPGWNGDVAVSFTAQTGTIDTISGTLDAKGERVEEQDVYNLRLRGDFGRSRERGSSQDKVIQNAQGLTGGWKHTFTDLFFWNSDFELSRDNIQQRDVRATIATGPGVRAWHGEDAAVSHFDLNAGVGYRFDKFDGNGNQAGAFNSESHFVDLVAGFEYKNLLFDDRMEFTHTGKAQMPANEPSAYLLTTEVIIGLPLTEAWSFRTSFLAQYTAQTPDEINRTKTVTTIGLGYKF